MMIRALTLLMALGVLAISGCEQRIDESGMSTKAKCPAPDSNGTYFAPLSSGCAPGLDRIVRFVVDDGSVCDRVWDDTGHSTGLRCSRYGNDVGMTVISIPPNQLTPAAAGETLLQRFQRTKADYDRARAAVEAARDRFSELDLPAFEAYQAAQKDLSTATCAQLCQPVTK